MQNVQVCVKVSNDLLVIEATITNLDRDVTEVLNNDIIERGNGDFISKALEVTHFHVVAKMKHVQIIN